jgi:hypothetical protein
MSSYTAQTVPKFSFNLKFLFFADYLLFFTVSKGIKKNSKRLQRNFKGILLDKTEFFIHFHQPQSKTQINWLI